MPRSSGKSPVREALLLVIGAGAAFSLSGPLARYARPAHPMVIVCGRVAIAALLLVVLDVRGLTRSVQAMRPRQRLGIAGAGVLLAAHFALFVWGLERTSLPAAVALVSLEPLSVVLFMWAIHHLRPTRLEQVGVFTATAGALLVARGAGSGEHRLDGDLMVLAAVALYGLYIAFARQFRGTLSAGSYAALVYTVAAAASACALPLLPASALVTPPPHALVAIVALALIPTLIGHTAVQAAARTVSPAIVALVSPGETLGGLAIGALWLGARPEPIELAGAAVIVAGATVAILGARRGA
jgi:drug/metabolite transporter (DMT)-like permease